MNQDELQPLTAAELTDAREGPHNLYADAREHRIHNSGDIDSPESEGSDSHDVQVMRGHEHTLRLIERLIATAQS